MTLQEMFQPAIDNAVSLFVSAFISIGIPGLMLIATLVLVKRIINIIGPPLGELIIMALIGVKDKFFDLFAYSYKK